MAGTEFLVVIPARYAKGRMATVAVNGARNAALLAIRIMALSDARLAAELDTFIDELANQVRDMDAEVVARYEQV